MLFGEMSVLSGVICVLVGLSAVFGLVRSSRLVGAT
jgi:uncharacterized membrane protein YuzA (DUF378 family)